MHGHCNFYPSTTKIFGARHRIRTGTPLAEAADFKSAVSTNFTTRAVTYQNSGASRETRTLNPFGTGFLDQRVYHSTTNAMNELYSKTTCVWRSFFAVVLWCARWDSNPQYLVSETSLYTNSSTCAKFFSLLVRRLLRATSFGALLKGSLAEYP